MTASFQFQRISINHFSACACARVHVYPGEADEDEELHGKLEEDRFLFSVENNSAACDVLDLREVLSVFVKDG